MAGTTSDIFHREGAGNAGKYYDLVSRDGLTDVRLYRTTPTGLVPLRSLSATTTTTTVFPKFGACPTLPNAGNLASVTTKYGAGAAVRMYGGNFVALAANYYGSSQLVHYSFKPKNASGNPDVAGIAAGTYDAAITTMANSIRAGDVVEFCHEIDQNVTGGLVPSWSSAIAAKNQFYNVVKAARPDVLVANTYTGYFFQSGSPHYAEIDSTAGLIKGDILGIDCDGVHPTALPYTDYQAETTRALKFLTDFASLGYRWISVPEYGCPNINQFAGNGVDTNDSARATWMTFYGNLWINTGKCLYALAYDYESSSGNTLTAAGTISAWTDLVTRGVTANGVDTTPPTVPTSVTASAITSTGFTLTWAASTDAVGVTGYEVQIDGVTYGTTTGATTIAVTGRTTATTYSVRVRARDAAGNYSNLSTAIPVTTT